MLETGLEWLALEPFDSSIPLSNKRKIINDVRIPSSTLSNKHTELDGDERPAFPLVRDSRSFLNGDPLLRGQSSPRDRSSS